jgi:large repetitive protein
VADVAVTIPSGSRAVPIAPDFTGGGTPATVHVAQAPSHGIAIAAGLTLTYKPDQGYRGTDTFTYAASNADGTSQPATVTVTVQ